MILVDAKMPKRGCRNCPMNYDIDYCKITHKCVGKEFVEETFPSWCPIKAEIPDNATNGDVICALWNVSVVYEKGCYRIIKGEEGWSSILKFSEEWWNAPYKKE